MFMNTPESGMETREFGFFNSERAQFVQKAVACPPEEDPVRTTLAASARLYLV